MLLTIISTTGFVGNTIVFVLNRDPWNFLGAVANFIGTVYFYKNKL